MTNILTPESMRPSIDTIIRARTPEEISAAHKHFLETGELESSILAKVGAIPNPQEFGPGQDGGIEFIGSVSLGNGGMTERQPGISRLGVSEQTAQTIRRRLGPVLAMIDADYRGRTGIDPDVVTHPGLVYDVGPARESRLRLNIDPHIDGMGHNSGLIYLAALGAGTKIYPGKFTVDMTNLHQVMHSDIVEKVKEEHIQPVELTSGDLFVCGWDTVHAGPTLDSIGQPRGFLRVTYGDFSTGFSHSN